MRVTVRTAEIIYKEMHAMDTTEVIQIYEKYAYRYNNLTNRKTGSASAVAKFRLRIWEHIKASVIELRDRGRWDEVAMAPIPIAPKVMDNNRPLWVVKGLKPGTSEWAEHWKRYPKEQMGMAKHSVRKGRKL
jgi:hypothetical protein